MTNTQIQTKPWELMELGVRQGVFPGGVLLVSKANRILHHSAHGSCSSQPPLKKVTSNTFYDLASLTKVLTITPLILKAVQSKALDLETRIGNHLPGFDSGQKRQVTLKHLLEHSAGLPAWRPYFYELGALGGGQWVKSETGKACIRNWVVSETLQFSPGSKACYSDLGFILLHWILEEATQTPLESWLQQELLKPLGICQLFFVDLKKPRASVRFCKEEQVASTEYCPWRNRIMQGQVHDENCYAMGGVSGHAGLFGTAEAVLGVATTWLQAYHGNSEHFDPKLVRMFSKPSSMLHSTRALGFDTRSATGSFCGKHFSPNSFGHLGYTGTSLWIDPERELIVVLLTNRVHPTRNNQAIRQFRPAVHDLVANWIAKKAGGRS